jgi:hypothetical protein
MTSWRGRIAVLASRGEVDAPRVDECRAALSNWRLHRFLTVECNRSEEFAAAVVDGSSLAEFARPSRPRSYSSEFEQNSSTYY